MMGTWFLANAAANKFAGTLSALIPPTAGAEATAEPLVYPSFLGYQITNLYEFFMLFIVMTGVAAGILFVLSSWLQKMMNEHHDEFKPDLDHQ
jgi:POT family proton-dependent oligopeptide transporter